MTRMRPVVIDMALLDLPESGFYTDDTMLTRQGPTWSTRAASLTFFGNGKNWLQHHALGGHLLLDGEPMQLPPRTRVADIARWRLIDIEHAAHGLTQSGYLDVSQLVRTITIVRLIAETWGFIAADGTSLTTVRYVPTEEYPAVRVWAAANGYKIGTRGWIANPILTAYVRATWGQTG